MNSIPTISGVVVSVSRNGVTLDEHAAALWGVERNFPGTDNSYLSEVANELADEALDAYWGLLDAVCDEAGVADAPAPAGC